MTPAAAPEEDKAGARRERARERSRLWREANPEKAREATRRYRAANLEAERERERESARQRRAANPEANRVAAREGMRRHREANPGAAGRWREANREAERERGRLYREANPGANREAQRRWYEAHPEAKRGANLQRRARLAGVPHEPWTLVAILERDNWTCQLADCLCPDGRSIDPSAGHLTRWEGTADHIIPISKCGPDTPENLQAAHRACNSAKGDR
jgi:5-methylcytosine-specific restriction endonuclease McrA